jgi:hypothetical protein
MEEVTYFTYNIDFYRNIKKVNIKSKYYFTYNIYFYRKARKDFSKEVEFELHFEE